MLVGLPPPNSSFGLSNLEAACGGEVRGWLMPESLDLRRGGLLFSVTVPMPTELFTVMTVDVGAMGDVGLVEVDDLKKRENFKF